MNRMVWRTARFILPIGLVVLLLCGPFTSTSTYALVLGETNASDDRIAFTENRNQWADKSHFKFWDHHQTVSLLSDRLLFHSFRSKTETPVVGLHFEDATQHTTVHGLERRPEAFHFLIGNDPDRWQRHVPRFDVVQYREVGPGIDIFVHERDQQLAYDLRVRDLSSLSDFSIRCQGTSHIELDADGGMLLRTSIGTLRQTAPRAWQIDRDGTRLPVQARFVLHDELRFGFEVVNAQPDLELIIDPTLYWTTFVGGSGIDISHDIAFTDDGSNDLIIVGETALAGELPGDFPGTGSVYQSTPGGTTDAFIARLAGNGQSLVYATFLGGTGIDKATEVDILSTGTTRIAVAGTTEKVADASNDFPTSSTAFQSQFSQGSPNDGFVAELSIDGTQLYYGTFFGGNGDDIIYGMEYAADESGDILIAGMTRRLFGPMPSFPTTENAYQAQHNAGAVRDGFIARIKTSESGLAFSTYFGGNGDDIIYAMTQALDGSGDIYVGGETGLILTAPSSFPITEGAVQPTFSGDSGTDGFVARLVPDGSDIVFSTFLGGNDDDRVLDLAAVDDGTGAVVVTGNAGFVVGTTTAFPTTEDVYSNTSSGGPNDIFLLRLTHDGTILVFSTFIGGSGPEGRTNLELAIGPSGKILLTGDSSSADFPTTEDAWFTGAISGLCPDPTGAVNPCSDAFVLVMDPVGSNLLFSSLLGGASGSYDVGRSIRVHGEEAVVVGTTAAADFLAETTTPQIGPTASFDGFILSFNLGDVPLPEEDLGGGDDDAGLSDTGTPDSGTTDEGSTDVPVADEGPGEDSIPGDETSTPDTTPTDDFGGEGTSDASTETTTAPDTSSDTASDSGPVDSTPETDSGGCGCQLHKTETIPPSILWILGLVSLWFFVRRRDTPMA